jgi:hypothetical protein
MAPKHLSVAALVTCAALVFSAPAAADPVSFDVTPTAFTPDVGYGTGLGQLNVTFSVTSTQQLFALSNVGDASIFTFGTVTLVEPFFIGERELDHLNVSATFQFVDPLAGLQQVTAVGTAVYGLVNDLGDPTAVDLTIDWAPLLVPFGDGGSFSIDMGDLSFTTGGQALTQQATVTLLSAPVQVPEPATLALVGIALVGIGAVRRRSIG